MLLPCPHCKRRFKFSAGRVPAGRVKVKCPACKGYFVVDTAPLRRIPEPVFEPLSPALPRAPAAENDPQSTAAGEQTPGRRPLRPQGTSWTDLWLLLLVSGVLVALVGILAPALWKTPTLRGIGPDQGELYTSYALQSSVPNQRSHQAYNRQRTAPDNRSRKPTAPSEDPPPGYRSLWPFSPVGQRKSCEHLAQFGRKPFQEEGQDRCSLYSPWIAYLSLETSDRPACDLGTVFHEATEDVAHGRLCGRGYAFLSAYYSYKRILGRSRSFLEQALRLSPEDPWVKLVEGIVHFRDFHDSEKAVRILSDLVRSQRSFSLAQYHLAKIYIAGEEYGKGRELFELLEEAFPHQPGFMRIRQSLASIEQVPYYSAERAKGLLKVSRALSDLMDYPLAGQLCRKVLEDLKGTLSRAEQTSAFYDLGRIWETTGDKEAAFTCYQNALRIDPFYRDARERIRHILRGSPQTS